MALRVAIIGCGGIARAHWNGWGDTGGRAEVVALSDINDDALGWFRERAPKAKVFGDFRTLFGHVEVDAVDICLPHDLHAPAILAAVRHGHHWICEKPLCTSLDEAAQIEQAMRGSKLVGMSAHNQVFMPSLCEARRMIEAGYVGEVYTIFSQDCFIMGLPPEGALPGTPAWSPIQPGTWRADPKRMGGGELIDTGYHPSYRLLFLAQGEPVRVAAAGRAYRNKHMKAEDTATVVVAFDNGITGLIHTSWAMSLPAGHHPFHVIGSHGELYGGGETLHYKPARFGEPAVKHFTGVDGFRAEVLHFLDCIEKGGTPVQDYVAGIRVLRMLRMAYESMK